MAEITHDNDQKIETDAEANTNVVLDERELQPHIDLIKGKNKKMDKKIALKKQLRLDCRENHQSDDSSNIKLIDFDNKMKLDADVDINVAPLQHSRNNILNALNDDCIQEMFRRMQNIADFLSAAEVCVRYQVNAKECYPKRFKYLEVGYEIFYSQNSSLTYNLSFERMPKFLSIFGHFLQEIHLYGIKTNQATYNVIADFCGETLKALETSQCQIVDLRTRSPFRVLEYFSMCGGEFRGFNVMPPLQRLTFHDMYFYELDWLAREFPELENIELFYISVDTDNDVITEFIQLNPQLRRFQLNRMIFNQSILDCIGKRLLLLENLSLNTNKNDMDFMVLSGLRHLKSLQIHCRDMSIQSLLDTMAENCVPLEKLSIRIFPGFIESLVKLKSITKLELFPVSDEELMNVVQSLPVLKHLNVYSFKVTINGIKEALRYGRNLQEVRFLGSNIKNSDEYNSMLALARDNDLELTIPLSIEFKRSNFCIPLDVLQANKRWLNTRV